MAPGALCCTAAFRMRLGDSARVWLVLLCGTDRGGDWYNGVPPQVLCECGEAHCGVEGRGEGAHAAHTVVCCSGHSLSLPPCVSQTRLKAWIDGVTATVLELPKPN